MRVAQLLRLAGRVQRIGEEQETVASQRREAGFDVLARYAFDIVVCDQRLARASGAEFLAAVRTLYPDVIRILMGGARDTDVLTDAINAAGIHK